ncbi:hypothetical protein H6S82_10405, partial [Planktothrix sp. FACHB-1355]|nr:hypothetical protein [Planktothrix sp. FACHB-1355]
TTLFRSLEQAIIDYQNALKVFTRETYPKKWALLQYDMGVVYTKRSIGDKAENLERAIAYYQNALQIFTHDDFPELWEVIQQNLESAYSDFQSINRS